jgi:hypothetical protein
MFRKKKNVGVETVSSEQEKYESFICERLHERGIILQPILGRPPAHRCGNLLGLDIIYDPLMGKRGGVYIETRVQEIPPLPFLFKATLFRDGAWLYGIGDYELFYIFGKKTLQRVILGKDKYFPGRGRLKPLETETGAGFIMPFEQADALAERRFYFNIF